MHLSPIKSFALLGTLVVLVTFLPLSFSSQTDESALLSLKALITGDPSNALSSWNDSSSVCQWRGVTCDGRSGRVTTLDLEGLGLAGSITPSIGNLSHLRFLYLQGNHFTGALPDQLGDLSHLEVLNASSNLIDGVIPLNISKCSSLSTLDLSANAISGRIPPEMGLLSKLQNLKMAQNQLVGPIPASLGNLTSLNTLDLSTNTLSGTIPGDLGRLRNLQVLKISINNITGTVPSSLYNLSSISTFDLASNWLHGEIPSDVGFRLPNLLVFHVCINNFTGRYPPSLHNLSKIQSIRMSHNDLYGPVPQGLGNLHDLILYNLGYNRFVSSGRHGLDFITSLTNSTNLQFLAIDGNLFEGVIPESVGNLSTSLSKIYLSDNRLFGGIPASIERLTNLTLLNMNRNFITGQIPPELGNLNQLRMLGLAGNRLSGIIPSSLGNLTSLTSLDLNGNRLEGGLPNTFGELQSLLFLDLSSNNLNGSMPRELFTLFSLTTLLNLSSNELTGWLPEEIGNLESLISLDLSGNLLSGSIPSSIGKCNSLQAISMSDNSLSGLIPDAIGDLKALQSLDLSSNRLSGVIPVTLGKLRALQFLNLSSNNLEGNVPAGGVFRNLSNVDLEGNPRLCLASSSCNNKRAHSSRLLHVIVYVSSALVLCLLMLVVFMLFVRRRDHKVMATTSSGMEQHPMVSYDDLQRATDKFNPRNLIGVGSFGSVYKGTIGNGMLVAIKVLNLEINGVFKSFVAECNALRNVRHRNLVKLVTLCSSIDFANNEFIALVYDFMSNGSLEDWIRGRRRHGDGRWLSVPERLDIAIDVASALNYLHNGCEVQVVHCDLKPSNVMLDVDMTAKVGDFGLARVLAEKAGDYSSATSSLVKGSIGYIPPEYGLGRKPWAKGDVYSYGIMLLELLTGRSPTDESFSGDVSLERWVRAAFPDAIMDVVEVELLQEAAAIGNDAVESSLETVGECLASMVGVGLSCVKESPDARITMRDALLQLKHIRQTLTKPRAV